MFNTKSKDEPAGQYTGKHDCIRDTDKTYINLESILFGIKLQFRFYKTMKRKGVCQLHAILRKWDRPRSLKDVQKYCKRDLTLTKTSTIIVKMIWIQTRQLAMKIQAQSPLCRPVNCKGSFIFWIIVCPYRQTHWKEYAMRLTKVLYGLHRSAHSFLGSLFNLFWKMKTVTIYISLKMKQLCFVKGHLREHRSFLP